MFRFFRLWLGLLARCFRSHRTLLLENLALRQQLTVLKRNHLDHFRHNPKTSVAALRLLIGIAKLLIAFTENR